MINPWTNWSISEKSKNNKYVDTYMYIYIYIDHVATSNLDHIDNIFLLNPHVRLSIDSFLKTYPTTLFFDAGKNGIGLIYYLLSSTDWLLNGRTLY